MITIIIISKNEEKMLPDALKSAKWADEILLVDTGSTDKTVDIARKARAKIYTSTEDSFSGWRNDGLKNAKGDWILYLDADERIPRSLRNEIKKIINSNTDYSMFAIPRKNIILGKEFKHGGFWPDYVKRLYRKEKLKGWKGDLHEEPNFEGQMSHLVNPLTHIKHEDFSQMVEKTNKWSEIEAKLMFDSKHPPMTIPRFVSAMIREFWYRMVLKLGFMDGPEGIMFAMYQVYSRFVSYAKLWELQERERIRK